MAKLQRRAQTQAQAHQVERRTPAPAPGVQASEVPAAPAIDDGWIQAIEDSFGAHASPRPEITSEAALPRAGEAEDGEIRVRPDADLHVLAHEWAHVVQQRHGVPEAFTGGEEGHAHAVADAVVAGESAVPLLDACVGGESAPGGPLGYHDVQNSDAVESENGLYRVRDGALSASAAGAAALDDDLFDVEAPGGGFGEVTYVGEFFGEDEDHDCLGFAEQMAMNLAGRGEEYDNDTEGPWLEDDGGRSFGESGAQNRVIAASDEFVEDADAAPDVGEAYAICISNADDYETHDGLNYHAATVIAVDGGDRVTCETWYGREEEEPVFDMYGTEDAGQSFHEQWTTDEDDPYKVEYGSHTGVLSLVAEQDDSSDDDMGVDP